MPVPSLITEQLRRPRRWCAAALLLAVCAPVAAKPPQPEVRIQLEALGYQSFAARMLAAGNALLTVHFVDEDHLLVTFGVRRLLKRIPNEPINDDDRTVHAVLLELPSGRELANTEWRLHDHAQYLWSLGHGHFALRVHDTLYAFAPLDNLDSGEPFRLRPFLSTNRHIRAILMPPEADLLTIETTDPVIEDEIADGSAPRGTPVPVQINFYRLIPDPRMKTRIIPVSAGVAMAKAPVDIPINAVGYINVLDQGRQQWAFDFHAYSGKLYELPVFDSTCKPFPIFVTRSEFIALACHGGNDRQQVAAFNLKGDEMWEQVQTSPFLFPAFSFAPSSGRFAISRVSALSAAIATADLSPSQLTGQGVDVYQIDSGALLLHTECTPIARSGQNFALSPEGLHLAVVRDSTVEVYHLPALTKKDQAAIQRAEGSLPEPAVVPVNLTALSESSSHHDSAPETDSSAAQSPAAAAPAAAVPATTDSGQPASASTDSQPPAVTPAAEAGQPPLDPDAATAETPKPRKPPTLYAPGEKPQDKNGPPQ